MRSPPPQDAGNGTPLTWQWMRIMALSDCTGWRFSSREYSPRGFCPVGRTRKAGSDVGAAPKLYKVLPVIGGSVTQPSSVSGHAALRDGGKPCRDVPLSLQPCPT